MTATIISVKNEILLIESLGEIYIAKSLPGVKAKVGDFAEFSIKAKAKVFSYGKAEIISIHPLCYEGRCLLSRDLKISNYKINEYQDNPVLCGEGATLDEALSALEETAIQSGANAVLDLKITPIILKFRKGCLYRVTGFAALAFKDESDRGKNSEDKLHFGPVRRNSKNLVKIRYLRMMLCYIMLIVIPCLLKISLQYGFSLKAASIGAAIIVLIAFYLGFAYFPKKRSGYLIISRKRFAV